MERDLKVNGKVFEVIKYRVLGYEEHLKLEAITKVCDIYKECNDGLYLNTRTKSRTDIWNLPIETRNEFYKELIEATL